MRFFCAGCASVLGEKRISAVCAVKLQLASKKARGAREAVCVCALCAREVAVCNRKALCARVAFGVSALGSQVKR